MVSRQNFVVVNIFDNIGICFRLIIEVKERRKFRLERNQVQNFFFLVDQENGVLDLQIYVQFIFQVFVVDVKYQEGICCGDNKVVE